MRYLVLALFILAVGIYVFYAYRKKGRARPPADDESELPPSARSLMKALEQAADSPEQNVEIVGHEDGTYSVKPPGKR